MKKLKSTNIIRVILIVYSVLYALLILEPIFTSNEAEVEKVSYLEIYTVSACFLVFIIGVILSWFNMKKAGIILMIYHFAVWFFALTIWQEAGMVLVLVFPVLILAAFLVRNWFVETGEITHNSRIGTQFTLDVLLMNYAGLYFFTALLELLKTFTSIEVSTSVNSAGFNYISLTGAILLINLLIFIAALVLLRNKRIFTGLLLIVWYIVIIILSITSPEFSSTGPWVFFALPILVNGIFYIRYNN